MSADRFHEQVIGQGARKLALSIAGRVDDMLRKKADDFTFNGVSIIRKDDSFIVSVSIAIDLNVPDFVLEVLSEEYWAVGWDSCVVSRLNGTHCKVRLTCPMRHERRASSEDSYVADPAGIVFGKI